MSTIIMIILAAAIIFWHPPFQLPRLSKRTLTPIIMIIILSSLLLVGAFKSTSDEVCCQKTASQNDFTQPQLNQSTF